MLEHAIQVARPFLIGFCLALSLSGASHAADEPADEHEGWDVDAPPGESLEVPIDVQEGTWMSLDVSPDGQRIVFDLLGDIFVMPIDGGTATQITSGMSWDMQPRFSHAGDRIAFISDRSGGDNIWVMDADGSELRQITDESFRLLHNPDWMPGDDYIVARKHFTGTRSLGAGEMWLYHTSGGEGLQLVERLNDQKDINEPRFSADGRYLYYTLDVTPGDIWQYNKDASTGVFSIRRLDLDSGETVDYVSGPGGAVHPLPSPDGGQLAFVRRVDYDTHLFVKDTESGRERSIYGALERDNQENWSVHGLYANMAWTPGSESIVFWADGGIHRIDVTDGSVSEIPFRVRKTMEVRPTQRVPVAVAPERFEVRLLRGVSVSPDGERVLYEALGKLWVQPLDGGPARRLTRQSDHMEAYPSWSPDGDSVVYASWDDQALGAIRVVRARGGEGRILTEEPGHYLEPRFSPDGERIVYRKASGGYLTSPWWSDETGIYVMDADGDGAERISTDGQQASFTPDGDAVLVLRGGGDSRTLARIRLDDRASRDLLTSTYGSDFTVSPDGRWVAWQERFQVYVAAMPATGRAISVGPSTSSHPVAKVSRDAGNSLHWSGDSKRIHWSLGDELYTQELSNAFAFLDGAPETLPDPPATGRDIGFEVAHAVPDSMFAVVGARVITMRGDEVIEDGVVVVDGNRIVAVGPRDEVEVPAGAEVVDAAGHTVVPGFVDSHWHGSQGENGFVPEQNWENLASLAFGVTTVHDPSNDNETIFLAKEMARTGAIVAPRIFSTGRILYGATTSFTAEVDSLEDALGHLRRMKAIGAESVKSYNQPRRDQRQQVMEAARQLNLNVVPEGGALFMHNMNMLVDGHTTIEHSLPVANIYEDVLQLWGSEVVDTAYTPTLGVSYGGIAGERYWYQHTDVFDHPKLDTFVPWQFVDPVARRRWKAPEYEYNHVQVAQGADQLAERGVKVTTGAHGQREGLALHWEMWMLAQGGMEPMQVLRSATLDGARALGFDAEVGSLEVGKLADLVIMEGDPLSDIRETDSVSQVMVNGVLYDARTMDRLGPDPAERPRLYWED